MALPMMAPVFRQKPFETAVWVGVGSEVAARARAVLSLDVGESAVEADMGFELGVGAAGSEVGVMR